MALFVFVFLMLEKDKRERKNNTKRKMAKSAQKNNVLVVGGGKEGNLLKLTVSRKIAKHYLVSGGGKRYFH